MAEFNYPYITIDGTCIDIGDLCKNDFAAITNNFDYQTTKALSDSIDDKFLRSLFMKAVQISRLKQKTEDFDQLLGYEIQLNDLSQEGEKHFNEINANKQKGNSVFNGKFNTAKHFGFFFYYLCESNGKILNSSENNNIRQSDVQKTLGSILGLPPSNFTDNMVPKFCTGKKGQSERQVLLTIYDSIKEILPNIAEQIYDDIENYK